jgi:menaquinone-dependent protoporphyrinogen oxidase
MARILVAYATKKGSTAEIAQAMGRELQAGGHIVDVAEMGGVTSLNGYDAVIIGAPMYMGKMIDTAKFVTRLRDGLMKLPVAGFIVSLAPVSKDPVHMANAQKALHESLSPLLPVAETVFAGSLDMKKLSWFQRWMTKSVKSPVGDFRDWAAITAWARELPEKLAV